MDRIIGLLLLVSAVVTTYYGFFDSTKIFIG